MSCRQYQYNLMATLRSQLIKYLINKLTHLNHCGDAVLYITVSKGCEVLVHYQSVVHFSEWLVVLFLSYIRYICSLIMKSCSIVFKLSYKVNIARFFIACFESCKWQHKSKLVSRSVYVSVSLWLEYKRPMSLFIIYYKYKDKLFPN